MKTDRSTVPSSRWALSAWMITLAATAAATYALDALATAAGVLLVASGLLSGLDHSLVLAVLAATYVLWGVGLRANLSANWLLLRRTGTSTNVFSKSAFELTRRRRPRTQRVAAGAGYVATELAKEAPYYAGAFGASALTNSVSSNDALLFLAGTNLGAAAYEYVLARLTRRLLRRGRVARRGPGATEAPGPTTAASPSRTERETIGFFTAAIKDAAAGEAVLVLGAGPTLHHVFLAAPKASEIHLADYLLADLEETERWRIRTPDAHDWRAFVRYTLECEGLVAPHRRGDHAARAAHPLEADATAPCRRAPPSPRRPALRDGHRRLLRGLRDRRSRHIGDPHGEHHRIRRARRPVHHGRPAPLPLLPGRRQTIPERERRRARPATGPGSALQPARALRDLQGHEAQGYSSVVLAHARRRAHELRPARALRSGTLLPAGGGL